MFVYSLDGVCPAYDGDAVWIAPTAMLIGNVRLKAEASVWFGAVLRADDEAIEIGQRSNIQDGAVLHVDPGFPLTVGDDCTIGHRAVLHGCAIGSNTLIGMGATVLNGARIGRNCVIGACALVAEGKVIPDNSLVIGVPGKVARQLDETSAARIAEAAARYVNRWRRYANALVAASDTNPKR
ncbi:MAG TPA: gamma carbonic anhydrase family protein [Pirellulales bacterium]|nr:gamma carbonic anhydrase family protein [Pirellulales bacterium]